jgi:hypothetical protein
MLTMSDRGAKSFPFLNLASKIYVTTTSPGRGEEQHCKQTPTGTVQGLQRTRVGYNCTSAAKEAFSVIGIIWLIWAVFLPAVAPGHSNRIIIRVGSSIAAL